MSVEIAFNIVALLVGLVTVITAFFALTRGRVRLGAFQFDFERTTAERVRTLIEEDVARGSTPQNALLKEYHAQGLSQSRVSFWFSLVFAALGFMLILVSVGVFLYRAETPNVGWLDSAGKPIFSLVAGTVIDAVAALFFVQSNKARQLMTEFFDKLRMDRKLDEALKLMENIPDAIVASRLRAVVSMHFSELKIETALLTAILSDLPKDSAAAGLIPSEPQPRPDPPPAAATQSPPTESAPVKGHEGTPQ